MQSDSLHLGLRGSLRVTLSLTTQRIGCLEHAMCRLQQAPWIPMPPLRFTRRAICRLPDRRSRKRFASWTCLKVGLETKPDEPALVSAKARWTWRELDQASDRLAKHLLGAGPQAGRSRGVADAQSRGAGGALPGLH